jgi:putative acetyltransferase
MTIRPCLPGDFEPIIDLFTETVRNINCLDYSPEQVAAWAPRPPDPAYWRKRLEGLTLWVAESDRQIVGFGSLGAEGHVDMLYVGYRFQRRGVARMLYQQVEAEARRNGVRRLFTEASISARQFFERMGFKILKEQTVELRGVAFTNFAMEKIIA